MNLHMYSTLFFIYSTPVSYNPLPSLHRRTSQQKTTGTGLQVVTEDPLAKDPPLKVHRLARASSEFVPPSGALPFEKRARAPGMGSFIEIPLAPDYEHRSSAAGNKRRSSAVLSFIEPDSRRMSSQTDVRSSHIKATDMRIKMDDKSHRVSFAVMRNDQYKPRS